ncbi:hypothetical protein BASA60_005795 [Batrachochytrium salamandrivorans]|nr:hypothetical protein BASA60_005795 [Batrachochytrium salamandrivorans]KAH9246371.1 hypothetical protein BASA81_016086 [Batrachochytrium salamandrivorans]KAH9266155.1 hypothetical protein BASA84_001199 [Batrachochytrium salamandrivorans]
MNKKQTNRELKLQLPLLQIHLDFAASCLDSLISLLRLTASLMKVRRFLFHVADPDWTVRQALAGRVLHGSIRSRLLKEAAELPLTLQNQQESHHQQQQQQQQQPLAGHQNNAAQLHSADPDNTNHTPNDIQKKTPASQSQQTLSQSASLTESELIQKLEYLRSEKRKIFSLVALQMKKKSERSKAKGGIQAFKVDPSVPSLAGETPYRPLAVGGGGGAANEFHDAFHYTDANGVSPIVHTAVAPSVTSLAENKAVDSFSASPGLYRKTPTKFYKMPPRDQEISHGSINSFRDGHDLASTISGGQADLLSEKYDSQQGHSYRRNEGRHSPPPPSSRYDAPSRNRPLTYGSPRYDAGESPRMPVPSARVRGGFRFSAYGRPGRPHSEWQPSRPHIPYEGRFSKPPFSGKSRPKE